MNTNSNASVAQIAHGNLMFWVFNLNPRGEQGKGYSNSCRAATRVEDCVGTTLGLHVVFPF